MTKENTLLAIGLGRPIVLHALEPEKIQKHYSLNKSYDPNNETLSADEDTETGEVNLVKNEKFISTDVDIQEMINSVFVSTFDYLLSEDNTNPMVKLTLDRLASRAKGIEQGVLFDSVGRKITTKEEALKQKAKLTEELIILQNKQAEQAKKVEVAKQTVSTDTETPNPEEVK